jgi:uncharacterized repeat protein (TIGR02543 family)
MPKVIQLFELSFKKESSAKKASKEFETKVNSVSNSDDNHFSLLHRGLRSDTSDPYSYRSKIPRRIVGGLKKTLDTGMSSLWPRCSSTYIKNQKTARILGASSAALLLTLLTLTVLPVSTKPKTAEAASGTSSSTTLTIVKASADLDLTTIASSGTFATSSASEMASFNVKTTNYTGYTLTISASDDTGTLTNTTSTGSFSSISGVIDEKTFDDSSYNGKWGYKPSKMNSTENVGFWPSPTTTATTLDVTKSANASFNNYTIALGARAAYTQPTGTYTKTVNLHVTSNPANYSVDYTDNTGDTSIVNIPDDTASTTSGTEIALSTVTPSRTGYVFNGWCDVAPTNSGTTCSGNTYSAGSNFPIDQTTTNIITLYATWTVPSYSIVIKPTNGIASVSLNGQSCTNNAGCTVNNLTYGQTYTLTATMNDGYSFAAWSPEGAGTVADITSSNTTFTVGQGTATITAVPAGAAAKTITVNFAAAGTGGTVGVSNVVFKESATGTTVGTVSTSGGTVKLNPGVGYTVTANTTGIYGVSVYDNGTNPFALNSASYGTLMPTTNNTTYFIPNSNNATITVTSCIKTITGTSMQTYATPLAELCDDATGSLTDSRDSHSYTVGVVTANNGGASRTLWMTKNLAVGCNGGNRSAVSLNSGNSNVSSTWSTSSAWNLDKNSTQYTSDSTCKGSTTSGCDSYTQPRMECSSTYGAWYNYVAATAGTITGTNNANPASYSVCPSGWKLPERSQFVAATNNITAFNPVKGGRYNGGTNGNPLFAYWWSSESDNLTNRWNLDYNSSVNYMYMILLDRYYGLYVRCVRA